MAASRHRQLGRRLERGQQRALRTTRLLRRLHPRFPLHRLDRAPTALGEGARRLRRLLARVVAVAEPAGDAATATLMRPDWLLPLFLDACALLVQLLGAADAVAYQRVA